MKASAASPRPMTKAEACKTLQVASTADEEIITQAYWHLARRYQATAGKDKGARQKLDELNRAYLVLHPAAQGAPSAPPPAQAWVYQDPAADEPALAQELATFFRHLVARTKARWFGRLPELVILTATTGVLTFLALSAGASVALTLLAAGLACAAILAPWRRIQA